MQLSEQINKKWAPVLDHPDLPEIKDAHRRAVTAICLENVEAQYAQDNNQSGMLMEAAPTTIMGVDAPAVGQGGVAGNPTHAAQDFADPVLISMVRRAMPQLIAYDICGVQPMSGPTGLIFALKARLLSDGGTSQQWTSELDQVGGEDGHASGDLVATPGLLIDTAGAGETGTEYTSSRASSMSGGEGDTPAAMSFSVEKVSVAAGTRALQGSYSMELAQDLRAVHGLDAEAELANILSAEILGEINREVVRRIYISADIGAQAGVTTSGRFDLDTDSNGRWMVEKFKGLMMQIEKDANQIGKDTRRGKGNIIITSSDVASALQMAGMLDYAPAMSTDLNTDTAASTFAGVLNGRYKVFVDPYADANAAEYYCVGYKGDSPMDAGIFYCPYVPLQMVRAVDSDSFQPKIAFKSRYGIVANPFAENAEASTGYVASMLNTANHLGAHSNKYYRKVRLANLM
tara:strand:- start:5714 stop:7093 length:1380 start_codon:yes stop_codon:yes gene_type:complete